MPDSLRWIPATLAGLAWLFSASLAAEPRNPAPDHSLTADAYIELGLPAPDREWAGRDFEQALEVLTPIAKSDPFQLPRYQSEKSGSVFRRLASPDNFRRIQNRSLPIDQRLPEALSILKGVSQVFLTYSPKTNDQPLLDSEMVELQRALLQVMREVFGVTWEFLATFPADDPNRAAREQGLVQMRNGLATAVSGALTTLTEHRLYRSSELLRLAVALEEVLPDLLPNLPPGVRAEIPVRLQEMIGDEADPALKEGLTRVRAAVEKARAEAPPVH